MKPIPLRSPPDELARLVDERGDEMSLRLRVATDAIRVWLGVFHALGVIAGVALGLVGAALAETYVRGGVALYFVIAMPLAAGAFVLSGATRRMAARLIADRIRRSLPGISGTHSSAAFSLGPRR